MMSNQSELNDDGAAETTEQPVAEEEATPAEDDASRPRSKSWLSKFVSGAAGAAKKVGAGAKKLGRDIGEGTKKVFQKKQQDPATADSLDGDAGGGGSKPAPAAAGAAPTPTKAPFPSVGARAWTPHGEGVIMQLEEGRAIVHLDWHLADGEPAKAYMAQELLARPQNQLVKTADKVVKKVAGFSKTTWAKMGDGMKKAGSAIKSTADKAGGAIKKTTQQATSKIQETFKKKPTEAPAQSEMTEADTEHIEAPAATDAAADAAADAGASEPAAEEEGEGLNPYM